MSDATPTNTPLEKLPNLGKTTVMWLRAIGIRDNSTLRDRGIFWAYQRMQARGFRVTTAVLFSLEGALQDRLWRTFSAEEKALLLTQLARAETPLDTAVVAANPAAAAKRAGPGRAGKKSVVKPKETTSKQLSKQLSKQKR